MDVFAFDRDDTVDTSRGPVPLDVVVRLAGDHPTYAIGNQALCAEADIPGVDHLRDRCGNLDGSDADHVAHPARSQRLRMVGQLHPEAHKHHIDDVDVGAGGCDGWTYWTPREFADAAADGRFD